LTNHQQCIHPHIFSALWRCIPHTNPQSNNARTWWPLQDEVYHYLEMLKELEGTSLLGESSMDTSGSDNIPGTHAEDESGSFNYRH